jgi:DNA polymerase-3 subunit epsilon
MSLARTQPTALLPSWRAHDVLPAVRASLDDVCGCFPTGRHYPGIADLIARTVVDVAGLSEEFAPSVGWAAKKLAVIDFETTGLDPANDRVIEIGVACFENGALSALQNWLVNPGIPVPEQARAVHNIGDEELKDAPPFGAVLKELGALVAGHLPVAYNALFDRGFLHAELTRAEHVRGGGGRIAPAFHADVSWIDPLVWVRELHKDERGHRLGEVCARLGIALDNAHRAASDAEATGRVLLALAARMPATYGELIRLQTHYAARQDVDMAINYRRR